jgi:hypothetical protein
MNPYQCYLVHVDKECGSVGHQFVPQCQRRCMFAAGVAIADFFNGLSATWVADGANVEMVGCIFMNISIDTPLAIEDSQPEGAILKVLAGGFDAEYRPFSNPQPQDTIVRMTLCTFTGTNSAEIFVLTYKNDSQYPYSASFHSDDVHLQVAHINGDTLTLAPASPLSEAPANRKGLTSPSLRLLQVRSCSDNELLTSPLVAALLAQVHEAE